MIEIISLPLSVRPRLVVFDFDGTLSLVRSGWQAVMRDLMVETLLRTPRHEAPAELERAAGAFIARSTGQPTLDQLAWLADEIVRRGGAAAGAEEYKRRFAARLSEQIERRLDDLRRGAPPDALLVPGARALLESLRRRDLALALVSGTDRDHVAREAAALEIAGYFDAGIYGPGPHDPGFAKPAAIARLLARADLPGAALVAFGDGPVETAAVSAAGGLATGVAFDEAHGSGLDPDKRAALIAAGAAVVVPDFAEHARLVELLFDRDKMTR